MAVKLDEDTIPGDLYLHDEEGNLYQIHSFCREPTLTMEDVVTGLQTGGAVGSRVLGPFKKLNELSKDKLLLLVESLGCQLRDGRVRLGIANDEKLRLKEEIVTLKEKIFEIKHGDT